MIPVLEHQQYIQERDKIILDMRSYHRAQGNNVRKLLTTFITDLSGAIMDIQNDPCRNPDFPAPVKKKLFSRGTNQCVLFYIPVPTNHMNQNSKVDLINLTSIMLTASGVYNEHVMGLEEADIDE